MKFEEVLDAMLDEYGSDPDRMKDTVIEKYSSIIRKTVLTWEDIPRIIHHCEQLKTSWWFRDNELTKEIGKQPFWEEVLKRFLEEKNMV